MAFPAAERAALLKVPRLGPVVLQRLEQAGLDSLAKLRAVGVDTAVRMVCDRVGNVAWANRRHALQSAVSACLGAPCSGPANSVANDRRFPTARVARPQARIE